MAYIDSRFCLQLSENEVTYTIVTEDMEQLSSFASACRRFRDSACMGMNFVILPVSHIFYRSVKCSSDVETYQWLEPYAYHPASWLSGMLLPLWFTDYIKSTGWCISKASSRCAACMPTRAFESLSG